MSDLRVRFGFILALTLFPLLLFSIYLAYNTGQIIFVVTAILAWLVAYFCVWIATDKLVFSHLRKIKTASDRFSEGDLGVRIGHMPSAPPRIESLGHAFDNMAENISERETRLLDNLAEKETLLREIHHRVKNNLQIIISLLNMQERKLTDQAGLDAIHETRSRINAISLVHRGLYEGDDLRVIDMPIFLSRLIDELKTGLIAKDQDIAVKLEIAPLKLEADTAIPVALFIVEALTNSVKHGCKAGGNIRVSLETANDQSVVSVQDDGVGSATPHVKGTGAKLMQGFARQLSGTFSTESSEHGYSTQLSFPN